MIPRRRWVHPEKARYYQVDLVQDLLGDWTLVLCWGGLGSKRGGVRILVVESEGAGEELIEAIGKRRRQRGYVERPGDAAAAELIRGARVTVTRTRSGLDGASEDLFEEGEE